MYGQRRFNDGRDKKCVAVVVVLNTVLELIEGGASPSAPADDYVECFPTLKWNALVARELIADSFGGRST